MATQVQYRKGTTAQHGAFAGAVGEISIDLDKNAVVVHDGATSGGFPQMRFIEDDAAPKLGGNLDLNGKALTGDLVISSPTVPTLATDPGVAGQIAWDSSFMYVCVAANTWVRTPLLSW